MKYLSDVIRTFDNTKVSTKLCISLSSIIIIIFIFKNL